MMRIACKTGVEKAWIVASVTALVLHRLLEVEPHAGGLWLVEGAMVILSFPLATVAMPFVSVVAEGLSGYANLSWLPDWPTLLFIGYIQWFWVLPEMRRNKLLVTLNLTSPAETSPVEASPVHTLPVETLPVETLPVETSPAEIASPAPPCDSPVLDSPAPAAFDLAAFVPPFVEFDEAGLTALERVLRAQKPSPPAPLSASAHIESISAWAR